VEKGKELGGGGSAGGGKPGGGLKGNLPGGQAGPGLPGDSIAPSMSGGGGAPGGPPSGGGAMASYETQLQLYNQAKEYAPAISRKSRIKEPRMPRVQEPIIKENEITEAPRTGMFNLTDIERILYTEVDQAQKRGDIPLDFLWQTKPVPIDPECSQIVADGMFPDIKLIVEADGKQWHSSESDIERDRNRDMRLQKHGWTILRFTEDEIKYYTKNVISKIASTVNDMLDSSSEGSIKAASAQGGYAYRMAKREDTVPMNEKEANRIDEKFKKTSSTIESEINIDSLKKCAEIIDEDLSEINKENEDELEKILEEKREIENLINN
jgi:very-short-patch-repair endonuclease